MPWVHLRSGVKLLQSSGVRSLSLTVSSRVCVRTIYREKWLKRSSCMTSPPCLNVYFHARCSLCLHLQVFTKKNLDILLWWYLCSPHDQCTFWQSWAQTCSPVGTDCSGCCRKPALETSREAQVWAEAPSGGWMKVQQHGGGAGRYLWCSPCLEQPGRWAGESGTSSTSSWFSSGPRRPYSARSSSLWKTCRDWEWISTRRRRSQTRSAVICLASVLLGIPKLLLLVLFFSTWRLGHVFLDGLVRLPGLRDTPAIIITCTFISKELLTQRKEGALLLFPKLLTADILL